MTTHTPGPWHVSDQWIVATGPYEAENWDRAWICQWGSTTTEANARLIAAAPDLLAALESMLEAFEPHLVAIIEAEAAITKATAP